MQNVARVLIVSPDRALRGSLASLFALEPDLEVWDCHPCEAMALIARVSPNVVVAGCSLCWSGQVIALSDLIPYEAMLQQVRRGAA